jgi:hypothetical protein
LSASLGSTAVPSTWFPSMQDSAAGAEPFRCMGLVQDRRMDDDEDEDARKQSCHALLLASKRRLARFEWQGGSSGIP